MLENLRTEVINLVRSSRKAQISAALLTMFFLVVATLLIKANSIAVEIDGKQIQVITLNSTVGGALKSAQLGILPEDFVEPSRSTPIAEGLGVKVVRSVPIVLTVDGQLYKTRTAAANVGEAMAEMSNRLGLGLKATDEVNWDRKDSVLAEMEFHVQRSVPIQVTTDGKSENIEMAPRSVAEALKKLNIVLGEKDKVSLPLEQVIKADDQIKVVRVEETTTKITSDIPYQVVVEPADFPVGLPDRIVKKGSNGRHEQMLQITYEDGLETRRQILEQRITQPPVNQVVSRGQQTTISRGGKSIEFKRAYVMQASAYTGGGITATGHKVRPGIIAVDPRLIPLGSKLYVDGYGEAVALDTGGAIKGNKIDVYVDSSKAAWSWGVRNVVVYVK